MIDPTLKWYVSKMFGTRQKATIGGIERTTHICDDLICVPVFYGSRFMWLDRPTNKPSNVFIFDLSEAWDHEREVDPYPGYPYDGKGVMFIGYSGYFIATQLTDGADRVVVHIVRKRDKLLIFNAGYNIRVGTKYSIDIPIKVYFPPFTGYSYSTNGTVDVDGVTISSGQYVQFYPTGSTADSVHPAGIFSISPLGNSKALSNELKIGGSRYFDQIDVPPMYTGLKSRSKEEFKFLPKPIPIGQHLVEPANLSGLNDDYMLARASINEPLTFIGRWEGGYIPYTYYTGWAEDENGQVRYILYAAIGERHNVERKKIVKTFYTNLYDLESGNVYLLTHLIPLENVYVLGKYVVPSPSFTLSHLEIATANPTKAVLVTPDDTYTEFTIDPVICWEFYDGYGFCNVFSDSAVCFEYLAYYTDDTDITISPKEMGVGRCNEYVAKRGLADYVVPFGNATMKTGKTYFAMARLWEMPPNLASHEYANAIKVYPPKVLTPTEYNGMVTNIPPYVLHMADIPDAARVLTYSFPTQVVAGVEVPVSGQIKGYDGTPYSYQKVVVMLIKDFTVVDKKEVSTDESGNFSTTVTPTTAGTYRVVIVVQPPPPGGDEVRVGPGPGF